MRYRRFGLVARALAAAFVVLFAGASLSCGQAATSGGGSRQVQLTSAGQTHGGKGGKGKGQKRVSQAELQEDLQRFAGAFMDRVIQAMDDSMVSGAVDTASNEALRLTLVFASSALDIATEPLPEVGVLDMEVFLRLNRASLVEYWVPKVLGERGQPFIQAFDRAQQDFSPIADKLLDPAQKKALFEQVDEWHRANPELVHVEAVRFTDFAEQAGAVAAARAQEARGILASVKAASVAADEAVLLGERAMFLATRMPFLVRLQARLGGREVMSDATALVSSTESLAQSAKELGPMVQQAAKLVAASTEAARQSRMLVEQVQPLIPTPEQVERLQHTLETANGLVVNTSSLVGDLRTTAQPGPESAVAHVAKRVDATMTRALGYLIALGAAWSLLWWGGYVLAKRLAAHGGPPSHRAPAPG